MAKRTIWTWAKFIAEATEQGRDELLGFFDDEGNFVAVPADTDEAIYGAVFEAVAWKLHDGALAEPLCHVCLDELGLKENDESGTCVPVVDGYYTPPEGSLYAQTLYGYVDPARYQPFGHAEFSLPRDEQILCTKCVESFLNPPFELDPRIDYHAQECSGHSE